MRPTPRSPAFSLAGFSATRAAVAALRKALQQARPLPFPRAWVDEAILAGEAEAAFARAYRDGLQSLEPHERRDRLPGVVGAVAESVAARVFDAAGFALFAQLVEPGARGADLLFLTPKDSALVVEVKGTLWTGALPRLRRSALVQMSAEWLDRRNRPMEEWGLDAADVYGAAAVVDLTAAGVRVATTTDFASFVAVEDLAALDDLLV